MKNQIDIYDLTDPPAIVDTLPDAELFGGVTFRSNINPDQNWHYGTLCAGQIKFTSFVKIPIGTVVGWSCQLMDESDYYMRGHFKIADVQKAGNLSTTDTIKYVHTAYDAALDFDTDITDWFFDYLWANYASPFTLADLADAVTELVRPFTSPYFTDTNDNYANVSYSGGLISYVNGWSSDSGLNIVKGKMPVLTARALLAHIADMSGVSGSIGLTFLPDPFDPSRRPIPLLSPYKFADYGNSETPIVTYKDRYANSANVGDDAVAKPSVVRLKTGEYTARSNVPSGHKSGDVLNVYLVSDNIFACPGVFDPSTLPDAGNTIDAIIEANMQTAAENIRVGLSAAPVVGTQANKLRPCTIKVFNDTPTLRKETHTTHSHDYASDPSPKRIFVGSSYYCDDEGRYHLTGTFNQKLPAEISNMQAEYAVSDIKADNYQDVAEDEWTTEGQYLYRFTRTGTDLDYPIYETEVSKGDGFRLQLGDAFTFDGCEYTRLYGARKHGDKITTPITGLFALATAYTIDYSPFGVGTFRLAGTIHQNAQLASHVGEHLYAIARDGDGTLGSGTTLYGGWLCEVEVDANAQISSRQVYESYYAGRAYQRHTGILTSKQIDKSGVTLQFTGSPTSETTEMYFAIQQISGSFLSITDAKSGKNFVSVSANIATASTGVTVARCGKNLCDLGTITVNGTSLRKICSGAMFPAGTYRLSGIASSTDTDSPYCLVALYRNGTVVQAGKYFTVRDSRTSVSFTPSEPFDEIHFYASDSAAHSTGDTAVFTDLQLEKASAASTYEEFDGNFYTLSWSSVAGSISSGDINLTTGKLTTGGQTYDLTPTAIPVLSGVNTMWADTGDLSVTYVQSKKVDLLATCTNKGYRSLSNTISGKGTDPNWQYGLPVKIDGQTSVTCSIQGYSTVASIMYFDASMNILSYKSGSTVTLSAEKMPSNATYIAVCCRNQTSWTGQYCYME